MKIGVCEKDLKGSLYENMKWMSENGFEGFQIWPDRVKTCDLKKKEIAKVAKDLGLQIAAIGGGPNLVDPKQILKSIDKFKGYLDLSVELGAGIVTAESKRKPEDLSDEDAWKYCSEAVGRICEYAKTLGVYLAIECSGACFIKDCQAWHTLANLVNSDFLKVNYDPANILIVRQDPGEGVISLGESIIHTHAKDLVFTKEDNLRMHCVPAGSGEVDYESYLDALSRVGYCGFLTIEMEGLIKNKKNSILKSRDYLKGYLSTHI